MDQDIRANRVAVAPRRQVIKQPRRFWTTEEVGYLKTHYPNSATAKVAAALSRPVGMVYRQAAKLGIGKSAEFDASPESGRLKKGESRGAAFRFRKGHVPLNKGLRRPGWSPGRRRETQFRKGERC